MKENFISLVIPTLNERENIETVIRRAEAILAGLKTAFEILIVDDHSVDGTVELVRGVALKNPRVRLIERADPPDLAMSVVDGWREAKGNILIVMDGDLQHPPEILKQLSQALIEDRCDLAIASRNVSGGGVSQWSAWRRSSSWVATGLARVLLRKNIGRVSDPMSGFFAMQRSVIEGARFNPRGYKILMEVLILGNCPRILEVPFIFQERRYGGSKWGLRHIRQFLGRLIYLKLMNPKT